VRAGWRVRSSNEQPHQLCAAKIIGHSSSPPAAGKQLFGPAPATSSRRPRSVNGWPGLDSSGAGRGALAAAHPAAAIGAVQSAAFTARVLKTLCGVLNTLRGSDR